MSRLVVIVISCLSAAGCVGQSGNYIVDSRRSAGWENAGGGFEALIGHSQVAPEQKTLLLAIIAATPDSTLVHRQMTGGDGSMVSATNLSYSEDRYGRFGYGSIWNRTSDMLAIDSDEFDRSEGNVFIVVPTKNDNVRIQIPGVCDSTNPREVLRFAQDRLEFETPELELIQTLMLK